MMWSFQQKMLSSTPTSTRYTYALFRTTQECFAVERKKRDHTHKHPSGFSILRLDAFRITFHASLARLIHLQQTQHSRNLPNHQWTAPGQVCCIARKTWKKENGVEETAPNTNSLIGVPTLSLLTKSWATTRKAPSMTKEVLFYFIVIAAKDFIRFKFKLTNCSAE